MEVKPLVCALLATFGRPELAKRAITQFYDQDYEHKRLIAEIGPEQHGWKMDKLWNDALRSPFMRYAVVLDDDDFYAKNRISRLVQPMIDDPKILAVGTSLIYYLDERNQKAWLYDNAKLWHAMWWIGAPCFRREAYEHFGPWMDMKAGADLNFLRKLPRERCLDLRDSTLMICRIHDTNAAPKQPHPPAWQEVPLSELPTLA